MSMPPMLSEKALITPKVLSWLDIPINTAARAQVVFSTKEVVFSSN